MTRPTLGTRSGTEEGVAHPPSTARFAPREPARRRTLVRVDRDNDLGEFLRARRALISPTSAGVLWDGARRVSGLRRDEVALLAGVSTDYYIRLEQGRERHPSRQVLLAVARALQLDDHATTHLLRLGFPELLPPAAPVTSVAPELVRMMDQMPTMPAFIVGPGQDVLAANALAKAVYRGFERFDNLLRMIFLDPAARDFYLEWDTVARTAVRNLRAVSPESAARTEQVVGALSVRSPVFARLWGEHDVGPRTTEDKRFLHPDVGELVLHFESFTIAGAPGQHLSVYSTEPAGPTADALAELSTLARAGA
jgi:transcriptional regulator with XRE-family HTH domain